MRIWFRLLLSALIFIPLQVFGQYYDTGQDPAGLKWLQIKTDKFRVIYPEKYGNEGIEFARSLEKSESALHSLFPVKKFRLPVVIHNFTTEANGYVAWAPKRMEIFPTPEQNTIPLDNKSQLTLHELTHVLQMESLNTGTAKALSWLFGEQSIGAFAIFLPLWYMEGDAVFSESVLSESGRGRSPDFQKKLKAIAIEDGRMYKYEKMVDGSYRNYVPDHYQSGYQAVTWSLASRDIQLWNRALKYTANEPFVINPINVYLKNKTGLTKKTLFAETFDTLRILWQKDIDASGAAPYSSLNPDKRKQYVNYYCPVSTGNDSVIAIKTSLSDPPAFVLINPSSKSEKKIHVPGYLSPYFFSYAGGKLCWVETTVDPRWANREYSVIRLLNLHTGVTTQLTRKSRYMAASLSPDGKVIAASENTIDNKNTLVFLGTSNGSVQNSVPAPGNASLQRPQWSADGSMITVILLTDAGEGISSYEYKTGVWKTLVEPGRNDIQSSVLRNDTLFFTSSVSGVENGYMLLPDGPLKAITNSRFGVNDLSPDGSSVIFCDYTSSGNNICSSSLLKLPFTLVPEKRSSLVDRFNIKSETDDGSEKHYTPEPYRKWQHLFNFHSWMPFYADPQVIESDPQALRPGVTLMSQNLLSTLSATVSYEYSALKRNILHTSFTWKGWYPVLETQLAYGDYPIIYKKSSDPSPASIYPGYKIKNTLSLPLTFYSGRFSQFLYLSASADVRNNYVFVSNSSGYDIRQTQIGARLYFYNFDRSSLRDIYPRWAQMIDIMSVSWPGDSKFFGPDFSVKTALYFPGILRNQSIRARVEVESQDFSTYLSTNRINFPRSYRNIISGKLQFCSVDYFVPICYPDFNISSVFYLTRIRASLFYDWAQGRDNYYLSVQNGSLAATSHTEGPDIFRSFGGQLLADFHLFRIPYAITGGVQAAWQNAGKAPALEAVFSMEINGTRIGRRNEKL